MKQWKRNTEGLRKTEQYSSNTIKGMNIEARETNGLNATRGMVAQSLQALKYTKPQIRGFAQPHSFQTIYPNQ